MYQVLAIAFILGSLAVDSPVYGQEPANVTGKWVGTWWMGKYEEPVELELVQVDADLFGKVSMWGYPGPSGDGIASDFEAAVTGKVEGSWLTLNWAVPGYRPFDAKFTLSAHGTLIGMGGSVEGITSGFELSRTR